MAHFVRLFGFFDISMFRLSSPSANTSNACLLYSHHSVSFLITIRGGYLTRRRSKRTIPPTLYILPEFINFPFISEKLRSTLPEFFSFYPFFGIKIPYVASLYITYFFKVPPCNVYFPVSDIQSTSCCRSLQSIPVFSGTC